MIVESNRKSLEELQQSAGGNRGLRCPRCHCQNFAVQQTRSNGVNQSIRRERICRNCGCQFRTTETIIGIFTRPQK